MNTFTRKQLLSRKQQLAVVALTPVLFIDNAMATLPDGASTAFTALKTDSLALVDMAWEVAIPVVVAFIVLRLFKKAASSAT